MFDIFNYYPIFLSASAFLISIIAFFLTFKEKTIYKNKKDVPTLCIKRDDDSWKIDKTQIPRKYNLVVDKNKEYHVGHIRKAKHIRSSNIRVKKSKKNA